MKRTAISPLPTTVGIRKFKQHLGAYAELLRRGRQLRLTDRGRYLATIEPEASEGVTDPELLKLVRRAGYQWSGHKPTLPTMITMKGGPISDTVLEDR